jgi:hypothetical protein
MPEPVAGEREELSVVGESEQDLGDRQRDELGVADLRWSARPMTFGQEVVHQDVNCREKGVEVGAHAAPLVDVAGATPDFGAFPIPSSPTQALPRKREHPNSESTI